MKLIKSVHLIFRNKIIASDKKISLIIIFE